MEIKLNVSLLTILNCIRYLEKLEFETFMLIAVALLLTPFAINSMLSLMIAVLYQLFWLGVKAGLILFTVCTAYLCFAKCYNIKNPINPKVAGEEPKCTMMDVVLSVLFQTGLQIPACIWDRLVGGKKMGRVDRVGLRSQIAQQLRVVKASIAEFEEDSDEDNVFPPTRRSRSLDGGNDLPQETQRTPSTDADFIQQLLCPTTTEESTGTGGGGPRRRRGGRSVASKKNSKSRCTNQL